MESTRVPVAHRSPGPVPVGRGDGFTAVDCICNDGVHSPVCAGQCRTSRIAVVLEGAFHARTSRGHGLLGHGAMLLGNPGDAYEYRHLDEGGHRCMSFHYDAPVLDAARRSLAGPRRADNAPVFEHGCLPAAAASAPAIALAREALRTGEPDTLHQAALAVLDVALCTPHVSAPPSRLRPSLRNERQVLQTIRYIEDHIAEDCSLHALAYMSGLSSFHFLRVFRALTGQTPGQFVIAARLRATATALRTTRRPITEIAMNAGYGDLSHFNASFFRFFGLSPGTYRKR